MPSMLQFRCTNCGYCQLSHLEEILERLRSLGKLRRAQDPGLDLILELANSSAGSFRCSECGQVGLATEQVTEDDDWQEVRNCEQCNKPIPLERLELFPGTTFCMECQSASDAGNDDDSQREFCPRCGGLMKVRSSRGAGIARYVMACQDCGHTGSGID